MASTFEGTNIFRVLSKNNKFKVKCRVQETGLIPFFAFFFFLFTLIEKVQRRQRSGARQCVNPNLS